MTGMIPLELLTARHGEFDGYTVYGNMFKLHGEHRTGWKVTSESSLSGVKHYWVEHNQFHTVVSHTGTSPINVSRLDIGDVIEVEKTERTAISRAVEQWTQDYYRKPLAGFGSPANG
jgi:hypothetical protein